MPNGLPTVQPVGLLRQTALSRHARIADRALNLLLHSARLDIYDHGMGYLTTETSILLSALAWLPCSIASRALYASHLMLLCERGWFPSDTGGPLSGSHPNQVMSILRVAFCYCAVLPCGRLSRARQQVPRVYDYACRAQPTVGLWQGTPC